MVVAVVAQTGLLFFHILTSVSFLCFFYVSHNVGGCCSQAIFGCPLSRCLCKFETEKRLADHIETEHIQCVACSEHLVLLFDTDYELQKHVASEHFCQRCRTDGVIADPGATDCVPAAIASLHRDAIVSGLSSPQEFVEKLRNARCSDRVDISAIQELSLDANAHGVICSVDDLYNAMSSVVHIFFGFDMQQRGERHLEHVAPPRDRAQSTGLEWRS